MAGSNNYKIIVSAEINTAEIQKQLNQFSKTAKIKVDSSGVKQATKDVGLLGVKWADAGKKFLAWKVIGDVFSGVERAITQMVSSVYELDTALTEFNKVTNLSEQQLDKFIDKAYEAGKATAKTGREMVEASTEFAKSGFSADDSLVLAKFATMYQNIADEAISAGDAAGFIISQIKAFNMDAKDAEKIISAVNEVSNNYAVSSADLANNLGKVSATMASSGTSYEQTLGMMTAITEITRTAGKSANALKTISQRIRGVGEDGEDASEVTGNLQQKFNELGISIQIVNQETGKMASTYDIMGAIAGKWNSLNDAQRQALGEMAAGKNRITEFNALMSNFGVAISATETALYSTGSAEKENAIVLESMKGKLQALKSVFENFSRETLNSDFLKAIIDATSGLIKFISSIGGLPTILTLVSGIIIIKMLPNFQKLGSSVFQLGSSVFQLVGNFMELKYSGVSLSASLKGVGLAINTTKLAIGGLTAVLTIAMAVFSSSNQKQEETKQKALETSKAFDLQSNSIKSLKSEYLKIVDSTKTELEKNKELIAWKQKLVDEYGFEKEAIDKVNTERQTGIDLLDEEAASIISKKIASLSGEYEKSKDILEKPQDILLGQGFINDETINSSLDKLKEFGAYFVSMNDEMLDTSGKVLKEGTFQIRLSGESVVATQEQIAKLLEYYRVREKNSKLTSAESQIVKSLQKQYDSLDDTMVTYNENYELGNQAYAQSIILANKASLAKITDAESYEKQTKAIIDQAGASEGLKKTLIDELARLYPQFQENVASTTPAIENQTIAFDKLANELIKISDKMSILNGAQEELSETGSITAKTFQALAENNLIQYLQVVDGKLVGVDTAMGNSARATRDNAIAQMQASLTSRVLAIAEKGVSAETNTAATSAGNAIKPLDDISKKYAEVGATALTAGGGISAFNNVLNGKGLSIENFTKEQTDAVNSAIETTKKEIAAYNSVFDLMGGGNEPSKKESSGGSNSDAWKDAFDKNLKDLQYKRDKDIISEENYYQQLESLNNKYFKNKSKYLDEYQKYEIEVYEYLKKRELEIEEEKRKAYSALKQDLEHEENILSMSGGSSKKSIEYFQQLQQNAHDESERLRALGVSENDDYLQELESQWWNYQQKITSIQKEEEEKRKEALSESFEHEKSKLEATLSIYEKYAEGRADSAQKEIDRLNEEKDKLEKLNDEREKAIQLQELEDALARAKTTQIRVYREGKGFVYEQDSVAVSDASKDLEDFKHQESLEKEQDKIEAEIKLWEDEKKSWESVVSNYKEQQDLLLAEQISGITLESLNQDTRLKNLQAFVTEYNKINAELTKSNLSISGISNGNGQSTEHNVLDEMMRISEKWYSSSPAEKKELESLFQKLGNSIGGTFDPYSGQWTFANGTNNYQGGALVVGKNVGEQGREIITPPKGSGIIPNPLTERLMEFGENPLTFISNLIRRPSFSQNTSGQSVVENYNISGVSVKSDNATDFLQSIKALAIQRTTNRR